MPTFAWIILALIVVWLAAGIVWRYAARRRSIPCPPGLDFFLENRIAGAEALRQIERARLAGGMSVLDVGCGTGRITIPAAQRVGATGCVVALDIQPEMLSKVARRAAQNNLTNVQTVRAAMGLSEFQERDRFDRAFLTTVLGEIPNRESALNEIYAALKPGGILSVTEIMVDPHYQSRDTVRRLATRVGLRVEQTWGNAFNFTMHLAKPDA